MGIDQSNPYHQQFLNLTAKKNIRRGSVQVVGTAGGTNYSDLSNKKLTQVNSSQNLKPRTPEPTISRPLKTDKTIYIQADSGVKISINFQISEEQNLTCGWLISETIRTFSKMNILPNKPIISLQTLNGILTLDYWLSDIERSVCVLKDGVTLKPYYGNPDIKISNNSIGLNDFHILKLIGTGGFSKVYLARRKDNGRFYAIKAIVKQEMIEMDKEETLFNERNIMTRIDHPFLAKLHYAFQSDDKLFFVMDFYPGGELFFHLRARKRISEEAAKVYMGEIILALNYLHKNNIIYRDLKPENILLDVDGHLHLADFGLCKTVLDKRQLNYTFCGSPEYMSPEIVTKRGYNFTSDFYSLGVLIYEMVIGKPPFMGSTQSELYYRIANQELKFPSFVSDDLQLFLTQILEKNPKLRLGAKSGLSEIVNHRWCRDIDFVKIVSKKGKAPILPDIYQSNFDKEFLQTKVSLETLTAEEIERSSHKEYRAKAGYKRFANFSFYGAEDLPKYVDSIFQSEENSPQKKPSNSQSHKIIQSALLSKIAKLEVGKESVKSTHRDEHITEANESHLASRLKPYYFDPEIKLLQEDSPKMRKNSSAYDFEKIRHSSENRPSHLVTANENDDEAVPEIYKSIQINSLKTKQRKNPNVYTSFHNKKTPLPSYGHHNHKQKKLIFGEQPPMKIVQEALSLNHSETLVQSEDISKEINSKSELPRNHIRGTMTLHSPRAFGNYFANKVPSGQPIKRLSNNENMLNVNESPTVNLKRDFDNRHLNLTPKQYKQ